MDRDTEAGPRNTPASLLPRWRARFGGGKATTHQRESPPPAAIMQTQSARFPAQRAPKGPARAPAASQPPLESRHSSACLAASRILPPLFRSPPAAILSCLATSRYSSAAVPSSSPLARAACVRWKCDYRGGGLGVWIAKWTLKDLFSQPLGARGLRGRLGLGVGVGVVSSSGQQTCRQTGREVDRQSNRRIHRRRDT